MAVTENEVVTSNVPGSKTMTMKSKRDLCDKSYTRESNLRMHQLTKHQMVRFQFTQCDLSYTSPTSLSSHIKIVHEGKIVKCNLCDHKTTKKTVLEIAPPINAWS